MIAHAVRIGARLRETSRHFDVVGVHELDGQASQHRLARVAQNLFVAGIHVGEALIVVDLCDEIERGLGQRPEAQLALVQLGLDPAPKPGLVARVPASREV